MINIFHQYQQNEQSPKTAIYDVGNLGTDTTQPSPRNNWISKGNT